MSLETALAEIREQHSEKIPEEARAVMERHKENLKSSGILEEALGADEKARGFSLADQNGELQSLEGALEQGRLILAFFRGRW